MKEAAANSYLSSSEEYIENLYEQYLENPETITSDWRRYFDSLGGKDISHAAVREYFLQLAQQPQTSVVTGDIAYERKQALVDELVYAYRELGHFYATLDPLGLMPKLVIAELDIQHYGFTPEDLQQSFVPDHFGDGKPMVLGQLIDALRQVYCQTIGAEFMHISDQNEVRWLQNRLENRPQQKALSVEKHKRMLAMLTAADGLEKYLGTKYVGQKRFSLEGGDSLIPLLEELIQRAGEQQVKEIVMGMAHRGRLNVLVNILGKSPKDLFDEFEGKNHSERYSGDVKYHLGFSSDVQTSGGPLHLALAFNPSHLEIISPVVTGSVRARQQRRGLEKRAEVMGVQLHGDAAFTGQGVVMETFSLSQTAGYGTGGTIHIVVNNQVGFTTDPVNGRSTYYCTDVAKMVQAPIFHVNADDPDAVIFVTQLAVDYRMQFGKDVVIDLICYRRHGHNEGDEPAATQPVMYQKIRQQPTLRKLYADRLVAAGDITQAEADALVTQYRDALDNMQNPFVPLAKNYQSPFAVDWASYLHQSLDENVITAVKLDLLKKLALQINTVPSGMTLQPQVAKIIEENRKMARGEIPMNWGFAENLAYATLLNNSFNIRISGQDAGRGTFAHRHAVWHDYQQGNIFIPLRTISTKAQFDIIDSILSEEAVVAFEYGYSTTTPTTLVIWEAQFGDFANGAQVVIDQFISSGEQKWQRLCSLTLLLPHGYEAMGPEHSSARLERYLQLCAQENMQVCVPTTPAQMFHLLRRQMLRKARKPLVIMTPKAGLRHKLAVSTLEELSQGEFQSVIPETEAVKTTQVNRIVFCSGKIYYDLFEARQTKKRDTIAIIRIEELYPFPQKSVKNILKTYKKAQDIVWCQEEPQNQGAWNFVRPEIEACLTEKQQLRYAGRASAAAPAGGSSKLHVKEQQQLVAEALG